MFVRSKIGSICLAVLFAASPAIGQTATAADLAKMVTIARDTCLATFPTYANVEKRLAASGLVQNELGTWRGESAIVVFRKAGSGSTDCEVWMSKNSKANDLSDRLQAELANMGVPIHSATRKGVRLSADFSKDGTAGTLRVEPMSGRSSRIVVSRETGS